MKSRSMKKICVLFLTVTMVLSMLSIGTFAIGTNSLTVNSAGNQTLTGRTFETYKLFDVTVSGEAYSYYDSGDSGQIPKTWGDVLISLLNDPTITKFEELRDKIETWADNGTEIKELAMMLQGWILAGTNIKPSSSISGVVAADGKSVSFTGLDSGYYIVVDTTDYGNLPENGGSYAVTFPLMATVTGDDTVNLKADVPSVEKEILDADSRFGSSGEVGDVVNYKITSSVPAAEAMYGYQNYYFTFKDTLSAGLTFNSDVVVMVGGHTLIEGMDYTYSKPDGTASFSVKMDLLAIGIAVPGTPITLEYSATINDNAIIGIDGNPNAVELIYSNDPKDLTGNITGTTTPQIDPTVYLLGMTLNKVDAEGNALDGAVFQLKGEKSYDSGELTGTDGVFIFDGLKAGETYTLTEIKAPDGYKPLTESIIFTITAEYNADGKLISLVTDNAAITPGKDAELGRIFLDVENSSGSSFPVTGGMGTVIFTVLGLALIGGACLLLFANKKKQS